MMSRPFPLNFDKDQHKISLVLFLRNLRVIQLEAFATNDNFVVFL